MISSGALPKVALSNPPIASPVRVASCSVDITISRAIGTIASAAEKNNTGARTCACSSATETGMKTNNQLSEGLKETLMVSARGEADIFPGPSHAGRVYEQEFGFK